MFGLAKSGFTVAQLAFLALFPGFFFYHTAQGTGLIGAALGGYLSWVALAFSPFLIAGYLGTAFKDKHFLTRFDVLFFVYLLYFLFVVAFNFVAGADEDVVKDHLVSILQFCVVYIVFKMADFSTPGMRIATLLSLAIMTVLVFELSVDGRFFLKQDSAPALSISTESIASYQGFARSYVLTALVAVAFGRGMALRYLVYAVSIPALFMNGARSEFIAFIVAVFLVEVFYCKHWILLLGTGAVLAVLGIQNVDNLVLLFPDSRTLAMLDLSADTSWQTRSVMLWHGLRTIAEHPFLGDYASYVGIDGPGSFIHNILSAWVDIGLLGFLYLLVLFLLPVRDVASELLVQDRRQRSEEFVFLFAAVAVTVMLLCSTKNFTDVLVVVPLGRYARYCMQRRRVEHLTVSEPSPPSDLLPPTAVPAVN